MDERKWRLATIALCLLYLVIEVWFNAFLIDKTSGIPSEDDIRRLELTGRFVSGLGATLLAFELARRKSWPKLAGLWLVIAPLMFFGQKALVDHLVDRSDAASRLRADYAILLKQGLWEGVAEMDGVPLMMSRDKADGAARTFLIVLGPVFVSSPSLTKALDVRKERIIRKLAKARADETLDDAYAKYHAAAEEIHRQFEGYVRASRAAEREMRDAGARAVKLWAGLHERLLAQWKAYERAERDFERRSAKAARRVRPRLERFYQGYTACRSASCRRMWKQRYDREMKAMFGRTAEVLFWCDKMDFMDKVRAANAEGVYRLSNFVHDMWSCPADEIVSGVMAMTADRFERKVGAPYGIADFEHFARHPKTAARIVEEYRRRGIALPRGWKVDDREGFLRAAREGVARETARSFAREMKKRMGVAVPPGLSWRAFERHPEVQRALARRMGELYVPGMLLDYDKGAFFRHVLSPSIRKEMHRRLEALKRKGAEYGNGGREEERGKLMYRVAIVPAMAMGVSLFFALVNLGVIVMYGVELARGRRFRYSSGVIAVVVLLICLLPFLLAGNRVSRSGTFGYFMDTTWREAGAFRYPLEWMMRMQPAIYPAGRWLYERLGPPPEALIDALDAFNSGARRLAGQALRAADRHV